MADEIEFEGLKELRAAVKALGDVEKTRQFKLAGYEIAAEVVIPAAQANAGGDRALVKAMSTLEAVKTESGGAVRLGKGFPAAFGYEFGADRNVRRLARPGGKVTQVVGWQQFEPWRGNSGNTGYALYPAIRENTDEIVNRFTDVIEKLFEDGGE